jgi:hypothetical protein
VYTERLQQVLVQKWICLYSLVAVAVIGDDEESGLVQQLEKVEDEVVLTEAALGSR